MEEEPKNEDLEMELDGEQSELVNKSLPLEENEVNDKHENQKVPEDQNVKDHNEINDDTKFQDDIHTMDEVGLNIDNGNSTSKRKIRKSKALMRKTTSCLDVDESLKAATRKRRNDITLADKVKLLEMMDASSKPSQGKIASHFNISQSQVSRIRTKRDEIIKEWSRLKNPARKRSRFGKAGNVEYKLLDWYEKVKKENNRTAISGPMIIEKARLIAQEEGIDFKPTDGWLGRWKERNGITLKRLKDKDGSFSIRKLANHWKRYMFVRATKDTDPNDVWVVDEVSFLYNLLPDFLNYQHRIQPEKMIACMAFNLTGTERRDPMVIGNSQCLSSYPLPISYQHSSEVNISKEHFAQWLRNWDRSLRAQKRKIILLMNKSAHHPDNLHLFNISINFFPPGAESVLQPFQFGISETFISLYRYQLLKHLLAMARTQTSNARNIQVSTMDALYMIWRSWKHISPDTLIKGVVKAGLSKEIQSLSTSDQVAPPPGVTQEDFDQFARCISSITAEVTEISQLNTDYSEEHSSSQRPVDFSIKLERNKLQNHEPIKSHHSSQRPIDFSIKLERNLLQNQEPINSHRSQSEVTAHTETLPSVISQQKEPNKSSHSLSDLNTATESMPSVSEALVACQIIRKYLQKKGGHLHNEFSIVESAIENDMIIEGCSGVLKDMAPDQLFDPKSVHSLISQKEKIEKIISEQQKMQEFPQTTDIKTLNSVTNPTSIVSSPESAFPPVLELTVNGNNHHNQQGQEIHHHQGHENVDTINSRDRENHFYRGEASRLEFGSELKPVSSIRYPVINQHSSKIQMRSDSKHQRYESIIKDNCSVPTFIRSTVLTDGRSAEVHSTERINEVPSHHISPSIAHGSHSRGVEGSQLTESPILGAVMRQTAVTPNHRQNSIQSYYSLEPNHYDTHYMQTK